MQFTNIIGNPKNGDIRLDSDNNVDYSGILQVYYNGTWGTVCGGATSNLLARHVCVMSGYPYYSAYRTQRTTKFLGPTMLTNVSCQGNPSNLLECNSPGWYNVPLQCQNHDQDFYVACSCTHYDT